MSVILWRPILASASATMLPTLPSPTTPAWTRASVPWAFGPQAARVRRWLSRSAGGGSCLSSKVTRRRRPTVRTVTHHRGLKSPALGRSQTRALQARSRAARVSPTKGNLVPARAAPAMPPSAA